MESENRLYKVERAIIVAAGIGTRLYPITRKTPKPLVKVCGTRMIDTAIDALHQNGIDEIYVVVGHLKEQFRYLEAENTGITLVENPYYLTCNNISSLYMVREHLKDVMILDGDQMIYSPAVLSPFFMRSGYNAVWTDGMTKEWFLSVKEGIVTACSRTGGIHGWRLCSVSRWTAEDGERLRYHLELEFKKKGNTQIYWDDIPLFCYQSEYTLGIREMQKGDILEIDSLQELVLVDPGYSYLLKDKKQ